MGLLDDLTSTLLSTHEATQIGVYGPPNAGKTTFVNQVLADCGEAASGTTSHRPHETRTADRTTSVDIAGKTGTTTIDIVDMPGVSTTVDEAAFRAHGLDEETARRRAREATSGISDALRWLREDITGVIYVLDATRDPLRQVNTMLIGMVDNEALPVLILANKTDLPEADVERVREAYPTYDVVPVSALEGTNLDTAYARIVDTFG